MSEKTPDRAEILSAGSVVLAGMGVRLTSALVREAMDRRRDRNQQTPPAMLQLEEMFRRAAAMSSGGQEDVLPDGVQAESNRSVEWMGSAEVAAVLQMSRRNVSRLAVKVRARRGPRGTYLFDPADIALEAERRRRD